MNTDQINKLLEKYYKAETTLEEEQLLRDLFVSGDYPPEFSVHAPLFLYCVWAAKKDVINPEWDKKLEESFRSLSVHDSQKKKLRLFSPAKVGALLLLITGLFFAERYFPGRNNHEGLNPMEEYAQAIKYMGRVSLKMNTNFDESAEVNALDDADNTTGDIHNFEEVQSLKSQTIE